VKQVLVYGDSSTWGIVPGTRERLCFEVRASLALAPDWNRQRSLLTGTRNRGRCKQSA
jgi:hypothetical protein